MLHVKLTFAVRSKLSAIVASSSNELDVFIASERSKAPIVAERNARASEHRLSHEFSSWRWFEAIIPITGK